MEIGSNFFWQVEIGTRVRSGFMPTLKEARAAARKRIDDSMEVTSFNLYSQRGI